MKTKKKILIAKRKSVLLIGGTDIFHRFAFGDAVGEREISMLSRVRVLTNELGTLTIDLTLRKRATQYEVWCPITCSHVSLFRGVSSYQNRTLDVIALLIRLMINYEIQVVNDLFTNIKQLCNILQNLLSISN